MATAIDTNVFNELGLAHKPEVPQANDQLGQDAFLKLVVAQLKNQDPMKPMENGEFLSQLAQFQSVTGIDELKNSVEKMATALQSNQALQASSLVGRWVVVPSDKTFLWDDVGMAGSVDVPVRADSLQVQIKDKAGVLVKQVDLGDQSAGTANFSWNGLDRDGMPYPPGEYTVTAFATIAGKVETLETNAIVPVESVLMGKTGESMTVNTAGLGDIKLTDVKQIM